MPRPVKKPVRLIKHVKPQQSAGVRRKGSARARGITIVKEGNPNYELIGKRDVSNQIPDPFEDFYGFGNGNNILLVPPYNFDQLTRVAEANSTLNQCIESYVVNIESYGFVLEYCGDPSKENSKEAAKQKNKALAFLENPSPENTLRDIREKTRKDYEYTGNKYYEIMTNRAGEVVSFDHIPSTTMRLTRVDSQPTLYKAWVRDPEDPTQFIQKEMQRYFRRFVQLSATGRRVYFKEWGDPRSIDPRTGLVNNELSWEDQATSIFHVPMYTPGVPYGIPRWIGALPVILGQRESELVNLAFFKENAIPAMAVLISGGALTEESFDNITNIIRARRGKDAMNRILILEATSDEYSGSIDGSSPAPRIEMKPMVSDRQTDGTFKDYEKSSADKILSSMRLPPIFIGMSTDYTKATAEAGQRMAEGQIFYPERCRFDDFLNYKVFPTMGITMWKFKSTGSTAHDPADLATFIDKFSKNGALTPNMLIKLANQTLDIQIPDFKEPWANVPFTVITTAIQYGYEIQGLESYIKLIQQPTDGATPGQDGGTKPVADGKPKKPIAKGIIIPQEFIERRRIQRMVKRELSQIASDLEDMIEDRGLAA